MRLAGTDPTFRLRLDAESSQSHQHIIFLLHLGQVKPGATPSLLAIMNEPGRTRIQNHAQVLLTLSELLDQNITGLNPSNKPQLYFYDVDPPIERRGCLLSTSAPNW